LSAGIRCDLVFPGEPSYDDFRQHLPSRSVAVLLWLAADRGVNLSKTLRADSYARA